MAVFKDVFYVKTRDLDYSKLGLKTLIPSVMPGVFGNSSIFKNVVKIYIDELIYFNLSYSTVHLFAALNKKNPDLKCSRMEEGVLSYNSTCNDGMDLGVRKTLIAKFRTFLKLDNAFERVENFYCFQPDFYKGALKPVKVPPIASNGRVKDVLLKIFNVNLEEDSYKEKYIFFTSVYDFEGGTPIGEYELVCKIADLVGKENLLVKTHPRDLRTIYTDNGFKTDKNSGVPWEAIQLSRDFSDKVFLTATSGSVLAGSFMSENPPKTFFMHNCCNISGNKSAEKSVEIIEELLNDDGLKDSLKTVKIAKEIKDISN